MGGMGISGDGEGVGGEKAKVPKMHFAAHIASFGSIMNPFKLRCYGPENYIGLFSKIYQGSVDGDWRPPPPQAGCSFGGLRADRAGRPPLGHVALRRLAVGGGADPPHGSQGMCRRTSC